jgi:poly-D-alanine transfer protein DltD
MTKEIEDFIKASLLKDEELLASIFKTLVQDYPNETLRQHTIRAVIMMFEEKYKPEMRQHEKAMKLLKETRENPEAANYGEQMRVAFRIPQSLMTRIGMSIKEPEFLSEEAKNKLDEWEWFRKNFPRYVAPENY